MHKRLKQITLTAILTSISLIIGFLEHLLPPVIPMLPFVRIGFSNIIILFSLIVVGALPAYTICILKSTLVPLFLGNPMMILYSLPSSLSALSLAVILAYIFKLGLPTISMLSSIIHNLVQIFVAFLIMGSAAVFGYLPYLCFIASLSGLAVGIIAFYLVKFIPKSLIIT